MALTGQFSSGVDLTAANLNASSIPVVSSTADIVTPFVGQIIFSTTDNRLYRYNGSAWIIFINGPTWQIRRNASMNLTSTTFTAITFDTDDNDTGNLHDPVTNSDRVTIAQAGLFALSAKGSWSTHATGTRYIDITLNGTIIPGSSNRVSALATPDVTACATPTLYQQCLVGDILRVREWHNAGTTLTTATSSADQPLFTGAWLHD